MNGTIILARPCFLIRLMLIKHFALEVWVTRVSICDALPHLFFSGLNLSTSFILCQEVLNEVNNYALSSDASWVFFNAFLMSSEFFQKCTF